MQGPSVLPIDAGNKVQEVPCSALCWKLYPWVCLVWPNVEIGLYVFSHFLLLFSIIKNLKGSIKNG